jgi:FSR family fosmidomycin resistance protein-like MFS transporter
MVPGVLVCAVLVSMSSRLTPAPRQPGPRPAFHELRPVARPLTLLYFAVVCRSAVSFGFMTFLPLYLHRRGYSVGAGGALLTVYLLAGAVGGFLGGWMAERLGARRVVIQSFAGALPLYFAFLLLPDAPALVCLVLGGFVLQGSLPVNVVLGQELSPRHSSTISSLLMGAAWGVGALLVGPVGALADARGLTVALACLASVLVLGLGCALALPSPSLTRALPELAHPGAVGK